MSGRPRCTGGVPGGDPAGASFLPYLVLGGQKQAAMSSSHMPAQRVKPVALSVKLGKDLSCLSGPMFWQGRLKGVLQVGGQHVTVG